MHIGMCVGVDVHACVSACVRVCECMSIQMCTPACFHGKHWREINSSYPLRRRVHSRVCCHRSHARSQTASGNVHIRPPCTCACVRTCVCVSFKAPSYRLFSSSSLPRNQQPPADTQRRAYEHTHHRQEDTLPHSCVGDERRLESLCLHIFWR